MEEIRKTWDEIGVRYSGEKGSGGHGTDIRRETALEKLRKKYLWFSRFALVFMIIEPFCFSLRFMAEYNVWIAGLMFMVYFGVCSSMDYWLYKGISSIDCYTMTVSEVVEKAFYYRKKHLQFIIILLPLALVCVGTLGYMLRSKPAFLVGMGCGGAVGLALGYRQYLEFMSEYKKLRE